MGLKEWLKNIPEPKKDEHFCDSDRDWETKGGLFKKLI